MKTTSTELPILAACLLLAACGKHEAPDSGTTPSGLPVQVTVETVSLQPRLATEEIVGTVRSKLRALVEAKVSGRIIEYLVTPGQVVKRGELLARIDAQEIQARVDQAAAELERADKDLARQEQLFGRGATSRQELEAAEARQKVAKATLAEAQTMLSYTRVNAPFDGVITRKQADVGDLAMPGKALAEIESPKDLRFESDLPEALIGKVKLGDKMTVRIASLQEPIEATVGEVAPIADADSRTFLVKFDLPAGKSLRSGQFGRVSVPAEEVESLLVPREAVTKRGQMEVVFVVNDGRAQLRLVKAGKTLDGRVEILSGLAPGEQVVAGDLTRLRDGQPVSIQP